MKEGTGRQNRLALAVRKQPAKFPDRTEVLRSQSPFNTVRGKLLGSVMGLLSSPSERQSDLFLRSRIYNIRFSDWLL